MVTCAPDTLMYKIRHTSQSETCSLKTLRLDCFGHCCIALWDTYPSVVSRDYTLFPWKIGICIKSVALKEGHTHTLLVDLTAW